MKIFSKNYLKRKIYKSLPSFLRQKFLIHFLPEIQPSLDDFTIRPARSVEEYLSAFNLVYKVFLKARFIKPSPAPFRLAPQHKHQDSRVFIGMYNNGQEEKLVYSVSLFPDSRDDGLPMDTVFKGQLDKLRAQGRFLVEAGHLASDASFRKKTMNIPMLGNKILFMYASRFLKADDIVIAVHPKFRWFYEELLLFEVLGEVSEYGYANDNPAVAMRLDLRTLKDRYRVAYKNIPISRSMFHFFFTIQSESISLPVQNAGICNQLFETIRCSYGIKP